MIVGPVKRFNNHLSYMVNRAILNRITIITSKCEESAHKVGDCYSIAGLRKNNMDNYDYSISFLRVLAMFFIIICHLGTYFKANVIAQFFNVGVQIFFVISGYLYGEKRIGNYSYWLYKRWLRLAVPSLLWLTVTVLGRYAHQMPMPEVHEVVFLMLNIQGLPFIFPNMKDLFIGPWFFTNIMACYILFALYKKALSDPNRNNWINKYFSLYGGCLPFLTFIVLACIGISTDGALAFFIGVRLKESGEPKKRGGNVIIAVVCLVISVLIRIIGKVLIDEWIVYNEIIAPLTHVGIACAMLLLVKWLFYSYSRIMLHLSKSYIIQHLDKISILVYLFHPMFFNGVIMDVFSFNINKATGFIVYFCVVFIFASVLWPVAEYLTKIVDYIVCDSLGL